MHDSTPHRFAPVRAIPAPGTPGTDSAAATPAEPNDRPGEPHTGCCTLYAWAISRGIEIKPSSPLRTCTCSDTPRPAAHTAPNPRVYVIDTRTDTVGEVMDHQGPRLQLRPPTGGREWEADPGATRPATTAELLSAKVRAANADSARGER
ncbi:hypothetical protein AF335_30110 [Streptomyces eurocidicus]|uniref:Uncharacterized protein n=1 Tax=Streptomyces eurocidicus TaxID=66423 RepID=A0A2N8NP07_STREU|nr:hypothetical protein [Streptomyces eurocidicus]MBB5116798.1 hypothetical protein [Streptomyces eurocidicus]PNE30496.1 hypothetical protein AF335_30110 [Streptomyces eurocidicus]